MITNPIKASSNGSDSLERVGEKVYMFVPANVAVEVDSGATAATSALRRANGEL